jgi:dUTP pyrophosphatase
MINQEELNNIYFLLQMYDRKILSSKTILDRIDHMGISLFKNKVDFSQLTIEDKGVLLDFYDRKILSQDEMLEKTGFDPEEEKKIMKENCCKCETNCKKQVSFDYVSNIPVKVKRIDERAIIPKYHSKGAAAFDVHAWIEDGSSICVKAKSQEIIKTGLFMSIPNGYELRISPRSGQSFKHQISIRNSPGIVDADFVGHIMIIFVNNADEDFNIDHGDRIAQVKLSMAPRAVFTEVEELPSTERGEGGFGSTGIK